MKVTVNKKYIVFPIDTNLHSEKKALDFYIDGKKVYTLNMSMSLTPNFSAYIDVSRFNDKTLEFDIAHEFEKLIYVTDEMLIDNLYKENFRPQMHFTVKNGWNNDPNGMMYYNGKYHLFYQYNPASIHWENMHWGHAESPDLIHWKEMDIALFPDDMGTMYSGSGIVDKNNLLGLKKNENDAAVLFYTATNPFCQCMAYSTDNFKTIVKYKNNPILPHIVGGNRDPKIVFCSELNKYVMALFLDGDKYGLFASDNLTKWEQIQELPIYGDNECPDIFKLKADNDEYKWVLIGAHDKYYVGDFVDGKFLPCQDVLPYSYSHDLYAAQSFSNMGDRVVRMYWGRPSDNTPLDALFSQQMSLPTEASLAFDSGVYHLIQKPIKELDLIAKTSENFVVSTNTLPLNNSPYRVKINGEYTEKKVEISVFGYSIVCENGSITLDGKQAPLSLTKKSLDIDLYIDRASAELYCDGGRIAVFSCRKFIPEQAELKVVSDSTFEVILTEYNSIWA